MALFRSSHPEVFLRKHVLKICSKFTREHPFRSVISIKLQSKFIEIALRHGCSSVNLLRVSTFLKKSLWRRCFPVNFVEFLRIPIYIEHLGWLLLNLKVSESKFSEWSYLDEQTQNDQFVM